MKRIRACAVVIDKNKVLLLWRKIHGNAYFVFPGGKKKESETLEEAAIRETFEETSIEAKIDKHIFALTNDAAESHFFICSYISGEPKLGNGNEMNEQSESNKYEPMWKEISEIPNLDLRPTEMKVWVINNAILIP